MNVGDALQGSAGANPRRLTNHSASAEQPHWSPDGTRIAFSSDRSDHLAIYVMQPGGAGLQQPTKNDADDSTPVWRQRALDTGSTMAVVCWLSKHACPYA